MRQSISPQGAPSVGPYSPAVVGNGTLYCSGQTPIDPQSGELVVGSVAAQTRQCFANLFNVLEAAGVDSSAVIRVGVYLTDMNDFDEMNAAYAEHFTEPYPARTTVGVADLPLGASVEIELTAQL